MEREVYKLKEALALMAMGKPFSLVVCSYDKNRPQKNGRLLEYRNAMYCGHEAYGLCTIRLANGEPVTIHPVLIEQYNGVTVTP